MLFVLFLLYSAPRSGVYQRFALYKYFIIIIIVFVRQSLCFLAPLFWDFSHLSPVSFVFSSNFWLCSRTSLWRFCHITCGGYVFWCLFSCVFSHFFSFFCHISLSMFLPIHFAAAFLTSLAVISHVSLCLLSSLWLFSHISSCYFSHFFVFTHISVAVFSHLCISFLTSLAAFFSGLLMERETSTGDLFSPSTTWWPSRPWLSRKRYCLSLQPHLAAEHM